MAKTQIKNINHSHAFMADWLIRNPDKDYQDLAVVVGMSVSHISRIVHSDAFQEYLALKREIHEERLDRPLVEKVEKLAQATVDKLRERIQEEEGASIAVLNETAKTALNALGMGGQRNVTQANIVVGAVDPELLARAREKMKTLPEQGVRMIDHDPGDFEKAVPATE